MTTAATAGKKPHSESNTPFRKSESHVERRRHTARAIPSWPFPPIRLTDRLTNPDAVTCPTCGRVASFRRSWCELCGRVT